MKSNLLILILLIVFPISTHALDIRKTVDRSIREIGEVYTCVLDDVDDGDTVDLLCGEKLIPSVRLLGVNAPDIIMPENQKHCYYSEARSVMRKIQQNKRKISAQFYGSDLCADTAKGCRNLVRLIDEETGSDINERLIETGYAFEWTNFSMVPAKLKVQYRLAEKYALTQEKGLWGKCGVAYYRSENDSQKPEKMTW